MIYLFAGLRKELWEYEENCEDMPLVVRSVGEKTESGELDQQAALVSNCVEEKD